MANDPVVISFVDNASSFASPVRIDKSSSSIRRVGGKVEILGSSVTSSQLYVLKTTHYNSNYVEGQTGGYEFRPSTNEFEFVLRNHLNLWVAVEIDGIRTNQDGYQVSNIDNGVLRYVRIQLPIDYAGRTVRLMIRHRGMGDVLLPTGGAMLGLSRPRPASAVFIGDSITEASQILRTWKAWPVEVAYRLGIDDPVQSGVGASGYLAAQNPGHGTTGADYNFRQRIDDVLKAIADSPPDALFVAGGINDSSLDPALVAVEVLTYLNQLRSAAPEMPIFVVTPFTDYANPGGTSKVNMLRDAILEQVSKVTMTYPIDVTGLLTISNRDLYFNSNYTGPHPNESGHQAYGEFIANAAADIIRSI